MRDYAVISRRAMCLVLLVGAFVIGQTPVFVGGRLDAVWSDGSGGVHVQSGHAVVRLAKGVAGLRPVDDPPRTLAPGLSFFDVLGGRELYVDASEVRVGGSVGAVPLAQSLLRSAPPGPPVRLPLLLPGEGWVAPARPRFLYASGDAAPRPLDVPTDGTLELGWGVGDPLEVGLLVPHLLARRHPAGVDLIVGTSPHFTLHPAGGGAPRKLQRPPFDDIDGILDFPFDMAPLCRDLDGNGKDDLLVADPSAGAVALYLDLDAETPKPTRVLLVDGLLLAAWADDFDGDGRTDLVLLRATKPGLAGQIKVIQQGLITTETLFYPGLATDGPFPKSPKHRRKLELAIAIGVQNEIRQAAFPALLVPMPGPSLLYVAPDGTTRRLSLEDDTNAELRRIPAGESLDGFHAVRSGDGVAFAWVLGRGGRVYWVKD
ncbi:MAG: hypothetical protein CMJ83_13065 [Planctomycetes bacterium]|nr:hypothetical protein [Planctomycetota bacterium]